MKFALVAGEPSGDLLGAGLIRGIREQVPAATFEGVAGPEMVAAGCTVLEDADALAVMGIVEPLKELPRLLRLRRSLAEHWTANPPDVFVGIDAPDFNLGLEKRLKKSGIATAHYVSPTVWAWRPGRIRTIKKACDCVLCILPFEQDFYDQHNMHAVFVGHPKADSVLQHADTRSARIKLGIDEQAQVVAVLPGSRDSEITRLGPIFAGAAAAIAANNDGVRFITPAASAKLKPVIEQQLIEAGVRELFMLLDGDSESAMMAADVVLLASGTAALEAALLARPTVAAYKVAPLSAAIFRLFGLINVEYFTMPNLLTEVPYIPEFIQEKAKPDALAGAVTELLADAERRAAISARFAKLRADLAQNANRRAADAVVHLAKNATR